MAALDDAIDANASTRFPARVLCDVSHGMNRLILIDVQVYLRVDDEVSVPRVNERVPSCGMGFGFPK